MPRAFAPPQDRYCRAQRPSRKATIRTTSVEAASQRPSPLRTAIRTDASRAPFGLGRRAPVLCVIRSAEPLRPHGTQGDAYVRFTHVRLPWAMMLNAFSVTDAEREGEATVDRRKQIQALPGEQVVHGRFAS